MPHRTTSSLTPVWQMAEGWIRTLRGSNKSVGVASAGIVEGTAIKPGAITVMAEAGVDIGPKGWVDDVLLDKST